MSYCVFIASSTATTSPSFATSPGLTGSLTMSPCIGAVTVPSPAFGRGGAAFALDDGAPAAGTIASPAPETRTLKTSPSTSTSNSAAWEWGTGGSDTATGADGAASAGGAVETAAGFAAPFFSGWGPRM